MTGLLLEAGKRGWRIPEEKGQTFLSPFSASCTNSGMGRAKLATVDGG